MEKKDFFCKHFTTAFFCQTAQVIEIWSYQEVFETLFFGPFSHLLCIHFRHRRRSDAWLRWSLPPLPTSRGQNSTPPSKLRRRPKGRNPGQTTGWTAPHQSGLPIGLRGVGRDLLGNGPSCNFSSVGLFMVIIIDLLGGQFSDGLNYSLPFIVIL